MPARAMLTDYHVHLRPDDAGHAGRALLHRRQRRALPRGRGRARHRGARRGRARPPLHGRAGRLAAPVLARSSATDDLDALRRLRARGDRPAAGHRGRLRRRAARTGWRRCSTRTSGTTSSARCTSSATTRSTATTRLDIWRREATPERVWKRYFETLARVGADRALRHHRPPGPGEDLGLRAPAAGHRPALLLRARGRGDAGRRRGDGGLHGRAAQAGRRDLPGAGDAGDGGRRRAADRALQRRAPARADRLRLRPGARAAAGLRRDARSACSSAATRRLEPLG